MVVEKVVDSRYQYDTDTNLAEANLGIGGLMQSVTDNKVSIESLDIDWHTFSADANSMELMEPLITNDSVNMGYIE